MKFRIWLAVLFAMALGIAVWYRHDLIGTLTHLKETSESGLDTIVKQIERQISTPTPLRAPSKPASTKAKLTIAGVVAATNAERVKIGLPALTINSSLNVSADAKVTDMFAHQYFAHVAPSGKDVGDLANEANYQYLAIGENLALGNFDDDADLVAAWMASPGHRANILNTHYTEIGVAVRRGTFEGKTTWLAVQHFGRPSGDCPKVDATLKAHIETNEVQLDSWDAELKTRADDIESTEPKGGSAYNEKVDAYNALVASYNSLLNETKTIIATYNAQIETFNACLSN